MPTLLDQLKRLWRERRAEVDASFSRTLPFGDYVVDRWEKARSLGFAAWPPNWKAESELRHNPNRNRLAFKSPVRRQVYAWLALAAAPVLTALWGVWIGGLCLALAFVLKAPRAPHNDDLSEELEQGLDGFEDSRY